MMKKERNEKKGKCMFFIRLSSKNSYNKKWGLGNIKEVKERKRKEEIFRHNFFFNIISISPIF